MRSCCRIDLFSLMHVPILQELEAGQVQSRPQRKQQPSPLWLYSLTL